MSDNQSDGQRLKSAISNHTHFDGIGRVINIDAAAAEFSQPYRDRIAELEAENALIRAIFVPPGSALILIAPEIASQDEMFGAAERASKVHDGPVVILPHDWQSISRDEILSKLDAVGASKRD